MQSERKPDAKGHTTGSPEEAGTMKAAAERDIGVM